MQVFKNLKIVELASVLAGPSVGQFFAELGAKVIKIENPNTKGDVTRSWKLPSEDAKESVSAYFSAVNWGKESVVLNAKEKADISRLQQFLKQADIVIASYKSGDAEKLGLDYKTLQKINPKIIYGHITGYGNENPKVGYDAIIQAEAGFTFMNGQPNSEPTKMPVALTDILAAHQLKEGLLIALYQQLQTGKGSYVSVSLFDSAVASLANQASNWLNARHIPKQMGNQHPNIVPYGSIFPTKDKSAIVLAIGNDKQFASLCRILEIFEISESDLYKNNQQRIANKNELLEILLFKIQKWNKQELLLALSEENVPSGGINSMKEVFETSEAKAILLEENGTKGVRQLVARFNNQEDFLPLSAPPKFQKR